MCGPASVPSGPKDLTLPPPPSVPWQSGVVQLVNASAKCLPRAMTAGSSERVNKRLVAGGAGFLGSSIIRELLDRRASVRVLALPNETTENLAGLDVEVV